MDDVLAGPLRRLRVRLGWAALLPVVMVICTVYWGVRPWTAAVALAAAAVAVLAPAVAADLLPVALIGLASVAFALVNRDSVLPPGSGTAKDYPLHALIFGPGWPHVADLAGGWCCWPAGVAGAAHDRRAFRAGPAQRRAANRVRRLTVTRVEAMTAPPPSCAGWNATCTTAPRPG